MGGLLTWVATWGAAYILSLLTDPASREHLVLAPIRWKLTDLAMDIESAGRHLRVNWWVTGRVRRKSIVLLLWPMVVFLLGFAAQSLGAPRGLTASSMGVGLGVVISLSEHSAISQRGYRLRREMHFAIATAAFLFRILAAGAAAWLVLDGWSRTHDQYWLAVAEFILALLVASAAHRPATWAERRARRRTQVPLGLETSRDVLLYLRAFGDDGIRLRAPFQLPGVFRSLLPFRRVRFEEALSSLLLSRGELVAVGRPGENLPELGAARTYLPTDDWQQTVRTAAHRCQAVFLLAGLTSGLAWELQQLREWGLLRKTLVILPPDPDGERSSRRFHLVEEVLGLDPFESEKWIYPGLVAIGFESDEIPVYYLSVGRDWAEYFGAVTSFLAELTGRMSAPELGHINRTAAARFARRLGPTEAAPTKDEPSPVSPITTTNAELLRWMPSFASKIASGKKAYAQGNHAAAVTQYRSAADIAMRHGARAEAALALYLSAEDLEAVDGSDARTTLLRQVLEMSDGVEDFHPRARGLTRGISVAELRFGALEDLIELRSDSGSQEELIALHTELRELALHLNQPYEAAEQSALVADQLWGMGRCADARSSYQTALSEMVRIGDGPATARLHRALAKLAHDEGDHAVALQNATSALSTFRRSGQTEEEPRTLGLLAGIRQALNDPDGARADLDSALQIAVDSGNYEHCSELLARFANLDLEEAAARARQLGLTHPASVGLYAAAAIWGMEAQLRDEGREEEACAAALDARRVAESLPRELLLRTDVCLEVDRLQQDLESEHGPTAGLMYASSLVERLACGPDEPLPGNVPPYAWALLRRLEEDGDMATAGRLEQQLGVERPMFERFSSCARRVIVRAQEAARVCDREAIDAEHLLLGVLGEPECNGFGALERLDASSVSLRRHLEATARCEGAPSTAETAERFIPFSARAQEVLRLAYDESQLRGHSYVGTNHIVVALMAEGTGKAVQVLQEAGVDLPSLRRELITWETRAK